MMNWLMHIFNFITELSKGNQLIAGAISLWGLATLTWVMKSVPSKIYADVMRQITTKLYMNNSTVGNNLENFSSFLVWFEKNPWAKYSRTLSVNGSYANHDGSYGSVVGVGDGRHYFVYKRRLFSMYRKRIENGGSMNQINYEITITMFGRSRKVLEDLIEEFRYKAPDDKMGIYQYRENMWCRVADIDKRGIDSVIIDPEIKADIMGVISKFQTSRQWYVDRGLSYKKTFMLYGPPGTGKTSLIKALASHYSYNICRINLAMMTDDHLENAFARAPSRAIILIEDFEAISAVRARSGMDATGKKMQSSPNIGQIPDKALSPLETMFSSMLTLSGVLQALEGIMPLNNKLIFLTTNKPEEVDDAVLRKGRVDNSYELGMLSDPQIREYIEMMFPGTIVNPGIVFNDILGCNLQGHYFEHPFDATAFIDSIPRAAPELKSVQA